MTNKRRSLVAWWRDQERKERRDLMLAVFIIGSLGWLMFLMASPAQAAEVFTTNVTTTSPGADVCTTLSATGLNYVRATATNDDADQSAFSNQRLKDLPGQVCWTNPTQNSDNTPLTDLAFVTVFWSAEPIGGGAAPGPPPGPPVILDQEEIVYTVVKQPNRFVLLPIGTVPAGTSCDPSNSVNGLGAVPTDAVVWTSTTGSRPIVVVARCDG